jgi:hypothetical protein
MYGGMCGLLPKSTSPSGVQKQLSTKASVSRFHDATHSDAQSRDSEMREQCHRQPF